MDYNNIYPQLPEESSKVNPSDFRLQRSCVELKKMEDEEKHSEKVLKKYKRARGIFTKTSVGSGVLSIILSGSGLTTSLTGIGIVVGVPLGALGGVSGLVSIGSAIASKRLSHKVSKHEQTFALAKAKTNTVKELVSKAMNDKNITDEEFALILREVEKFYILKQSIRRKHRAGGEKRMDLSQIKKDVRAELLKQLTLPER